MLHPPPPATAPLMRYGLPENPALKSLGKLAECGPVIVTDTREQDALVFTRLPSVRDGLMSGDYSLRGAEEQFAVERKSIPDFVSCCVNSNRERFFNELHRLRGFRFARLLIVGTPQEIVLGNYRSNLPPKAVFSTLSAIEARFGIAAVFIPTPAEAALAVESWAAWYWREIICRANDLVRAESADAATVDRGGQDAVGGGGNLPT